MSEVEHPITSGVHDGMSYVEDEKLKAVFSPSNASEDDQDAYSGINEKALLRKLDRTLLPALTLLYLLSFLDRSNGTFPNPDHLCSSCSRYLSCQRACRGSGERLAYE